MADLNKILTSAFARMPNFLELIIMQGSFMHFIFISSFSQEISSGMSAFKWKISFDLFLMWKMLAVPQRPCNSLPRPVSKRTEIPVHVCEYS